MNLETVPLVVIMINQNHLRFSKFALCAVRVFTTFSIFIQSIFGKNAILTISATFCSTDHLRFTVRFNGIFFRLFFFKDFLPPFLFPLSHSSSHLPFLFLFRIQYSFSIKRFRFRRQATTSSKWLTLWALLNSPTPDTWQIWARSKSSQRISKLSVNLNEALKKLALRKGSNLKAEYGTLQNSLSRISYFHSKTLKATDWPCAARYARLFLNWTLLERPEHHLCALPNACLQISHEFLCQITAWSV